VSHCARSSSELPSESFRGRSLASSPAESIETVVAEGLGAVVSLQLAAASAVVAVLLLAGPVYRQANANWFGPAQ